MILMNQPTLTRGNLQLAQQQKETKRFPFGQGTPVRVLVAGVYAGTNLKALPPAQVGDIITVTSGAYTLDLIKCGLVTDQIEEVTAAVVPPPSASGAEPTATPTVPPTETTDPPQDVPRVDAVPVAEVVAEAAPWSFWTGGGVTLVQAQALYEAGYTDKATLVARVTVDGVDSLTKIPGIGRKRAIALLNWSRVP